MKPPHRVLVYHPDAARGNELAAGLRDRGFWPVVTRSLRTVEAEFERSAPAAIVIGLVGEDLDPLEVIAALGEPRLPRLVLVDRTIGRDTIERILSLPVIDVVPEDFLFTLVPKVEAAVRAHEAYRELSRSERDAQLMLELTQALASSLDFQEILYTVVRRIAEDIGVERASIVLIPDDDPDPNHGFVVAASDDRRITNLRLELTKYPEIKQVLRTGEVLTINDVENHPLLIALRDDLRRVGLSAVSLFPIRWEGKGLGVMVLRASSQKGAFSERDINLCQLAANATAIALSNAKVLRHLRNRTQEVLFARFEAERKLDALKPYADLFASSADGIAVVDLEGSLLFANPKAYEILGYPPDSNRGEYVLGIVTPEDRARVKSIAQGFVNGVFPQGFDIDFTRHDRSRVTCSISTSRLSQHEAAVLVSFRDVTADRMTARELERTRDFLESLIDSSVDGIVAADVTGGVILINPAAERILGRTEGDTIGEPFDDLFPAGASGEVERMLRSPEHGGVGRLDRVRLHAISAEGEHIPIDLGAATLTEEGRPSAVFCVFTDLRERLRIEQRLASAQKQLELSEKQMLVAEFAGTAAHELNQPLTSVMGYAELLSRFVTEPTQVRAVKNILEQAQRMAEIVRNIGKMTRYETKEYVLNQSIIDLNLSSKSSSEDPQ